MEPLKRVIEGLLAIKQESLKTKLSSTMEQLNRKIDEILSGHHNKPHGAKVIITLSRELRIVSADKLAIANQMIEEHDAFKGIQTADRNKQYGKSFTDLLDHLKGTAYSPSGMERKLLTHQSDSYEDEYEELLEPLLNVDLTNQQADAKQDDIITKCLIVARRLDLSRADQIRSLMAHIFAVWTVDESRTVYVENKRLEINSDGHSSAHQAEDFLRRPHSGQILALLRIFGLDREESEVEGKPTVTVGNVAVPQLVKSAVEIGTGEGKSVTLAVTAIILALLGYEIDIVCYSEYLSNRDRASFERLFGRFGVSGRIQYGTFKDVCEKLLNKNGDVRQGVLAAMTGGPHGYDAFVRSAAAAQATAKPRVLLIDEVDVFFHEDFYMVSIYLELRSS